MASEDRSQFESMSSEAASSAHHRSVTSHSASKDDKADALVPSLDSERPYAKSTEIRNVILLGAIFSLYFALRSGCVVVLPLACKHLLQDELAGATHSPLYQLPLALWFLSDVGLATPNAVFMRRYGRRAGFSLGACVGLVAAVGAFFRDEVRGKSLGVLRLAQCMREHYGRAWNGRVCPVCGDGGADR